MTESLQDLSFEDAFQQLHETVQALEAGDLTLAESLALFERGVRLTRQCDNLLESAELHVRQIVSDGAGGFEAAPFAGWQQEEEL
ncbi:MAG: exodeoxyribonuclease VII small subunit [Caldilineales bacterium]